MKLKTFVGTSFAVLLLLNVSCSSGQQSGTAYSSDGTPVYYRVYGSGQPLLIINGGPGMNSNGFEELAKKFSPDYQAIIYDQRGTGKSMPATIDSATITLQRMMEDIESLRKQLKIEKWSVLGHSFGGMLASYYATLHPERINKMILSSSGGIDLELLNYVGASINSKLSKSQLDSVNYWAEKISAGDTSHYAKLGRGKNLAHAYVINKKFLPVIAERLTQGNMLVNQLIWTDMQKNNFDCSQKLKNYSGPVLIIQGKDDIIKAETAEKAHRVLKNSRVVLMDHCIHYGWLDNEEVYFREIHAFMAS